MYVLESYLGSSSSCITSLISDNPGQLQPFWRRYSFKINAIKAIAKPASAMEVTAALELPSAIDLTPLPKKASPWSPEQP